MIYLLVCPRCQTEFEFQPPTVEYLEAPAEADDWGLAGCPNGHISMYRLSGARIKNA